MTKIAGQKIPENIAREIAEDAANGAAAAAAALKESEYLWAECRERSDRSTRAHLARKHKKEGGK